MLVKSHGVFAFGKNAAESVYNATVMEEIAKMAFFDRIRQYRSIARRSGDDG